MMPLHQGEALVKAVLCLILSDVLHRQSHGVVDPEDKQGAAHQVLASIPWLRKSWTRILVAQS
jgi:hypothetical protein